MARLILDSGALIALAARDVRTSQFVDRASRQRSLVVVPAVVIAETTRGGAKDATINRVVNAAQEISPVTERVARMAGRLMAASGLPTATIDALVVAEAVLGGAAVILTGDPDDLSALAAGYPRVAIYAV